MLNYCKYSQMTRSQVISYAIIEIRERIKQCN